MRCDQLILVNGSLGYWFVQAGSLNMFKSYATIHSQVQGLAESVTGQRWTKSKCPGEKGSGIGNGPSYTHH